MCSTNLAALAAEAAIAGQNGNSGAARKVYEEILGRYPDFSPAERSLVLLYAAGAADSPKASDLAAKAREAYPDDPDVAKACGVIAYRGKDYARAVDLLTVCAGQRPDDGELAYYLGMAQTRLKDPAGKVTLQHALTLGLRDDLAADARKALAESR